METELLSARAPHALRYALDVLRHDGLVAFPTDTVYGVGALVHRRAAVQRLYTVKGRSTDKAIAVLVARPEQLAEITDQMTPAALRLAERFWPGSLTLVVPRHPRLPPEVSPVPTVGVRLPDHDLARQLIELAGPLAVTSANRSGEPNALSGQDVLAQLAGRIELILDGGRVLGGVPSTVVDCTAETPVILRAGPITQEQIEAVLRGE
jgi:L-threonylcarbamoyladenylate synthase